MSLATETFKETTTTPEDDGDGDGNGNDDSDGGRGGDGGDGGGGSGGSTGSGGNGAGSEGKTSDSSLQLLRPGYTYGLYAYALTLEGAKKLLASRPLGKIIPSDDFISVLCDTHPVLEYRKW